MKTSDTTHATAPQGQAQPTWSHADDPLPRRRRRHPTRLEYLASIRSEDNDSEIAAEIFALTGRVF